MSFEPSRLLAGRYVIGADPSYDDSGVTHRAILVGGGAGPYRAANARWVDVLSPHEAAEPHFLEEFQQSAAELASFGPPARSVIEALGSGGLARCVVLESLEGQRLSALLESERALPASLALDVAHRLSPLWARPQSPGFHVAASDVFVSPDRSVQCHVHLAADRARQVVGAAILALPSDTAYSPPESIRGRECGPRAGMYTLGVILSEMLLGRHPRLAPGERLPRAAQGVFRLVGAIGHTPLPPIAQAGVGLEPDVCAFVDRLVAHEPAERFESWPELLSQLAALRAGRARSESWTEAVPEASWPSSPPIDARWLAGLDTLDRVDWESVAIPARRDRNHAPPRPAVTLVSDTLLGGSDHRPMHLSGGLLVDARPVTAAEFERFRLARGRASVGLHAERPMTDVSFEEAAAYAAWAGKRLPTEREWTATVGSEPQRFDAGQVWEWTATAASDGWVVCGGRWRDRAQVSPDPRNRSHEVSAAPDVGFRCVTDP